MSFGSILFDHNGVLPKTPDALQFLSDLHLDQVIEAIIAPKREYDLKPFFLTPLHDVETIVYRQEVMRELESEPLMSILRAFAEQMSIVRRYLAMVEKLDFELHKKGWFLEAALVYCNAVKKLAGHLENSRFRSRGLRLFRDYVMQYVRSSPFLSLADEADQVKKALSEVRYCVIIENGKFKVGPYEEEEDYSVEVENTFAKFKQAAAEEYLVKLSQRSGMSHIEAIILEFVARLYPEPFAALREFCARHNPFVDETLRAFDREIQFYIAYLEFIGDFRREGLPFCYPQVSAEGRESYVREGFDLALALSMRRQGERTVVCNDFFLCAPERILVVTGPNQGGKTTFARMFGQLHYLASLGCPVPGREARLVLFDKLFTYFETEEDIRNLRGKLEDDLFRVHQILSQATPQSILIFNEPFASTALHDALFLSKEVMARVIDLDARCAWVTFLDELASMSEKVVSMVATVDPTDPTIRTFKVVRQPANGLAYAFSLAQKHRLTYHDIQERIHDEGLSTAS